MSVFNLKILCPESCLADATLQAGSNRGGLFLENDIMTMIPDRPHTEQEEDMMMELRDIGRRFKLV